MPLSFVFVPSSSNKRQEVSLEDIPQSVKDEVEEIYKALKSNPNGSIRINDFETKAAASVWFAQAQSYVTLRPEGALRIRRTPTSKLPETSLALRITDIPAEVAESAEQTQAIRDGVDAVKATAEDVPASSAVDGGTPAPVMIATAPRPTRAGRK
jgi:hypothetical protein